jgi:hypothetical protein
MKKGGWENELSNLVKYRMGTSAVVNMDVKQDMHVKIIDRCSLVKFKPNINVKP